MLSTEDIDHLLLLHERSRNTKQIIFLEVFRGGTCKFTYDGRVIPYIGRYGGLIWNNFGFKVFDVQAESPLSIGEGQQF